MSDYVNRFWNDMSPEAQASVRSEVRAVDECMKAMPDNSWVLKHACIMLVRRRLLRHELVTPLLGIPALKEAERITQELDDKYPLANSPAVHRQAGMSYPGSECDIPE